jgi:hypothetical protein
MPPAWARTLSGAILHADRMAASISASASLT